MKLTNRDVVESKQAVEGLLQLKPPPTAAIAAKIAINARQVNGAITDFSTAQKALFDGYAEDTEQVSGVLFVLPTEAQATRVVTRLHDKGVQYTTIQKELAEDDDAQAIPIAGASETDLVEQANAAVAEAVFDGDVNRGVGPLEGYHGEYYVFYIQGKQAQPVVPTDQMEAYREEIDELLDQEIDLRIRAITMAELERCEDKRAGFQIEPVLIYSTAFMWDWGDERCY